MTPARDRGKGREGKDRLAPPQSRPPRQFGWTPRIISTPHLLTSSLRLLVSHIMSAGFISISFHTSRLPPPLCHLTNRGISGSGFLTTIQQAHPLCPSRLRPCRSAHSTSSTLPLPPTPVRPLSRIPLSSLTSENMDFLQSCSPSLPKPVKKRISSLVSAVENAKARITVLEKENQDLRDANEATTRKRAGITVGNLGTHVFSAEDCWKGYGRQRQLQRQGGGKGRRERYPWVAQTS